MTGLGDILLRSLPDGLVVSDAEGVIRVWNAGAERIFGFTEAEAVGRTLDIIIPETLRERHWAGYATAMQTGVTRYGSGDLLAVPAIRKDGRRISIQFSIAPLAGEADGLAGVAAVVRDVSREFEERKALRSALEECRRAAAPKSGG